MLFQLLAKGLLLRFKFLSLNHVRARTRGKGISKPLQECRREAVTSLLIQLALLFHLQVLHLFAHVVCLCSGQCLLVLLAQMLNLRVRHHLQFMVAGREAWDECCVHGDLFLVLLQALSLSGCFVSTNFLRAVINGVSGIHVR